MKKESADTQLVIEKLRTQTMKVWVKGVTPIILNSMSEKVRQELLFPARKKTRADREQKLKHNPIEEYRNSVYRRNGDGPTRLMFPAIAFKAAMMEAALEIPGAKKTQIGRLVWVVGQEVSLYGIPKLLMSVVRSADMNRTPDVRTRAIVGEWCCEVNITFVRPTISDTAVGHLLETAGLVIGIGDFRQQKGKGNYGQFQIAEEKEIQSIIETGGTEQQDAALESPECWDAESESLLSWWNEERARRGM